MKPGAAGPPLPGNDVRVGDGDGEMRERIEEAVEDAIGPIARPARIIFTPELPKTRSGKIMRRLLEEISDGEELGDTPTLRNPEIAEEIKHRVGE